MKFPESWLRAHVDPAWSTEQLSDALTMAGLEVEEARPYAPAFSDVVVARVVSVTRHPDADKLNVCEVDTGRDVRTIVCGAPNVSPGIKVPCALPGAVLPGDFAIKVAKVRGVESSGMLCSARELGMSEDHSGLLILPADAPVGGDFRQYQSLDDTVFLLKLTPNRPDCLGVQGIAREVAALSGAPMVPMAFAPAPVSIDDRLPVRIEAPDLCGRFSGRIIRGVNAKAPTPDWIRSRLERAGQRSISALVDLSNYVMLELGRPTHVFDLNRIHGGLTVRWGARRARRSSCSTARLSTLDRESRRDRRRARGREPGRHHGRRGDRGVRRLTTDVYVEAAFWWPDRDRRASAPLQLLHRRRRTASSAASMRPAPSTTSST